MQGKSLPNPITSNFLTLITNWLTSGERQEAILQHLAHEAGPVYSNMLYELCCHVHKLRASCPCLHLGMISRNHELLGDL